MILPWKQVSLLQSRHLSAALVEVCHSSVSSLADCHGPRKPIHPREKQVTADCNLYPYNDE